MDNFEDGGGMGKNLFWTHLSLNWSLPRYGYQTTPYSWMEPTKTQKSVKRQAVDSNIAYDESLYFKRFFNSHINLMFEIHIKRILNA